ncbi:hypothetical protein [Streptomyces wuyuanensis]|uniref:Uncharacterized protein n=1 Tax=Streptomyces wuyuanensis TaxID=1196353 RepID=A0A1G9YY20_9ACTN|nr:hypothetical protein [Streptomyces wuyuanensis]SDN14099.1 hypothetical protein SAMN05444921_12025 [Streptomyces wuyuanensis]
MDDSRRAAPGPPALPALRGALPPPALCGFLLLLAVVFAGSYAVGSLVGPVAPGMHSAPSDGAAEDDGSGGTGHGHGGRD